MDGKWYVRSRWTAALQKPKCSRFLRSALLPGDPMRLPGSENWYFQPTHFFLSVPSDRFSRLWQDAALVSAFCLRRVGPRSNRLWEEYKLDLFRPYNLLSSFFQVSFQTRDNCAGSTWPTLWLWPATDLSTRTPPSCLKQNCLLVFWGLKGTTYILATPRGLSKSRLPWAPVVAWLLFGGLGLQDRSGCGDSPPHEPRDSLRGTWRPGILVMIPCSYSQNPNSLGATFVYIV